MNKYFITKIGIEKIRHLENIDILLDDKKARHLLLTGKNGSGKTTTLNAIKESLKSIYMQNGRENEKFYKEHILKLKKQLNEDILEESKIELEDKLQYEIEQINKIGTYGLEVYFNCTDSILNPLYKKGNFVLAYYKSNRATVVEVPTGVESIKLKDAYTFEENPSKVFIKYLVDLKTQQSFARNEGDNETANNIENWFNKFENAMKKILDDESAKLKFDYRNYDFKILQEGKDSYGFNELSDGYSSILNIVSDLILRIDKNRAGSIKNYIFDTDGIVLIDEIETHLHIELQKNILPFLIEFFPNIQFIVSTHSPFVLNSIDNSIIYDLEKNIRVENLSSYSYEGIIEGYFEVDNYSNELKGKISKYKELVDKNNLTDDEKAERAELRIELKNSANNLAKELKLEFDEIERKRKAQNDKSR